jgi:hypothetical protein
MRKMMSKVFNAFPCWGIYTAASGIIQGEKRPCHPSIFVFVHEFEMVFRDQAGRR